MALNFVAVQELNRRYNEDPRSFTDQEAEMIAGLSNQFGLEFQRESKPLQKGAFDFADIAAFGLLPNEWRPTTRGETVYGETGRDRLAGGVGSLGGLLGAVGTATGIYRGIRGYRALKKAPGFSPVGGGTAPAGDIVRKSAEGITNTGRGLLPPYEGGGALVPSPLRLTEGTGIGLGGRLGLPSPVTPLQLTAGGRNLLPPYRTSSVGDYMQTRINDQLIGQGASPNMSFGPTYL